MSRSDSFSRLIGDAHARGGSLRGGGRRRGAAVVRDGNDADVPAHARREHDRSHLQHAGRRARRPVAALAFNRAPGLARAHRAVAPPRLSRRAQRRPRPRAAGHLAARAGESRHPAVRGDLRPVARADARPRRHAAAGCAKRVQRDRRRPVPRAAAAPAALRRRRGAAADRHRADAQGRSRQRCCSSPRCWESWLKPGVSLGVAVGALVLLLARLAAAARADDAVRDRAAVLADRAAARARHVAGARAARVVRLALWAAAQLQRPDARGARRLADRWRAATCSGSSGSRAGARATREWR